METLADERENAESAIWIAEKDARMDARGGGAYMNRLADMLSAKLELIDARILIKQFTPKVTVRF